MDVLILSRGGATNREASRPGYDRTGSAQAREPAVLLAEDGTVVERRIVTSRERFTAVLGNRPRARILLEAREALVRTRTRYISLAKALVRRDGLRVAGSEAEKVAKRIAELDLSDALASELMPLFQVLAPINEQIDAADHRIVLLSKHDPEVALLTSAPSIGPITASAVVATVDDISRFRSAHQFEAFIGLVPGERSSGEKRRVGKITKAGNSRVRYLLVEAAWRIMRSRNEETAALRAWALLIAARRGKRIAVVALARRLAGILWPQSRAA